jgi:hypothetical protein
MLDRLKASHLTTLLDQMRAGNVQAIKEMGRIIDRIDAAQFGLGHDASDDDADDARRSRGSARRSRGKSPRETPARAPTGATTSAEVRELTGQR